MDIHTNLPHCSLCLSKDTELVFEDSDLRYYQCPRCDLVFLPACSHLSKEEEIKRYDLHENHPGDQRYQSFLKTLLEPLNAKLTVGATGLDYGCGPGPTVSKILEESGFRVTNYDPYYFNNRNVLGDTYDFITCTEVVEHFRNPDHEWQQIVKLVRKGGWVGVMTEFVDEITDFSRWHYRRDPTHICFYSKNTFLWISDHYNLEPSFPCKRVALLKKT